MKKRLNTIALLTLSHHAMHQVLLEDVSQLTSLLHIKILKPAMRTLEVASSTVIMDLLARRRIHHEIRLLDKFFKDGFRGLDSVL
jgi:hypothetical protein